MNLITLTTLLADETLGGTIVGPGRFQPGDGGDAPTQIENIVTTLFGFLTIIGGLAFLIYFVIGGLKWIMAGGDQQKVESAKNNMTSAAIGLIAVVAAYSIAWIIGAVLGFDLLNPAASLENIFNAI